MGMITPGALIRLALRDAGVNGTGQAPSAEDSNDAFVHLQMMLAQWQRKRWLIYHLVDVPLVSTGAASYTIGLGGAFNVPRPDRIEAGFVRFLGGTTTPDLPLTVVEAREDYNRIALKSVGSVPSCLWYDASYPLGTVYFYPVAPAGVYELHLTVKETLTAFSNLSTPINLPEEYQEALLYNLAIRLRIAYQMQPDPMVMGLAKAALATIRASNTQIPLLEMPAGLGASCGIGGGFFGGSFNNGLTGNLSALLATLPTTLPTTPGVAWNNGGFLSIS